MTTSPRRPGQADAGSPWQGVELLERAIGYTRGCLALVTPDLMSAPTPCAGWDLRRLLLHMDDSLTSLHEAVSVRRVRLDVAESPAAAGSDPVHPVETLRHKACQLLADWSAEWSAGGGRLPRADVVVAGRPITSRVLASAGALEVAVHGWDVAAACGADRPLPEALALDLLRVAPVLVGDEDRPHRFGPALQPADLASASDRLLAYLGRRPDRPVRPG